MTETGDWTWACALEEILASWPEGHRENRGRSHHIYNGMTNITVRIWSEEQKDTVSLSVTHRSGHLRPDLYATGV